MLIPLVAKDSIKKVVVSLFALASRRAVSRRAACGSLLARLGWFD
jgi:hypothetical protein